MSFRMHLRSRRRAVVATTAVAALASTAAIAAPSTGPKRTPEPAAQARIRPATPEAVRPLPSMEPIPADVAAAGADAGVAVAPEPTPSAVSARSVWDDLADCESGDWNANGVPITGTARWDYGLAFSHGDIFEGGVNFHPQTWEAYRDAGMPGHAGQASRAQQIAVAERVLDDQGWGAWPVCSRKIGLR